MTTMEIDFVMLDRLKFYCWIFTKKSNKKKTTKKTKKAEKNVTQSSLKR